MMKGSMLKIPMAVVGVLAIVIFLIFAGESLGLPSDTPTQLSAVLPGMIIFFVGVVVIGTQGLSVFAFPGFLGIGIGLALLMGEMNTANIVIPSVAKGGLTLEQMQYFVIIVCGLFGAGIAGMSWDK